MSAQAVEALLARLYADAALREEFLADPRAVGERAGLDAGEVHALERIDRVGLRMAAESYARKRGSVSASKTSR